MEQLDLPPLLELGAGDDGGLEGAGQVLQRGADVASGVAAGAAPFGAGGFGEQLDLLGPLDEPDEDSGGRERAYPTAQSRAANARSTKALKRAVAKASALQDTAKALREDLELASSVLPDVGRVLGRSVAKKRCLTRTATKPLHFCALAFAAFMPAKLKLNVGMQRKRMIAGCAKLVQTRQQRGINRLVANAAALRAARQLGHASFAVAVLTHEWDETRSLFRRTDPKLKATSINRGAQVGVQ